MPTGERFGVAGSNQDSHDFGVVTEPEAITIMRRSQ
jgi:hypothetical protein